MRALKPVNGTITNDPLQPVFFLLSLLPLWDDASEDVLDTSSKLDVSSKLEVIVSLEEICSDDEIISLFDDCCSDEDTTLEELSICEDEVAVD